MTETVSARDETQNVEPEKTQSEAEPEAKPEGEAEPEEQD